MLKCLDAAAFTCHKLLVQETELVHFISLEFHQPKVLRPMQALGEVMGLGKAVGKSHPKPHGGGGEVVHGSHRRGKRTQTRRIQFVLQHHIVLLLQASPLLRSPVLKPDFNLRI